MSVFANMRGRVDKLQIFFWLPTIVVWLTGLMIGSYCASGYLITSLMRSLPLQHTGFFSLLLVHWVPILLAYFLLRFGRTTYVLPVVLVKGFTFAFCACGLLASFGSASWLVFALVMCSAFGNQLVFIWFYLHCLLLPHQKHQKSLLLSLILSILLCLLDCFVVSPFLISLFN